MAARSLAPSTRRSYAIAMLRLQTFACSMMVATWFPSSPYLILAFIPHLIDCSLSHASIRSIMSAITYYHSFFSLPDPVRHHLVHKALSCDAKERPASDNRMPVTLPLLNDILTACNSMAPSHFVAALTRALFSTMFFAFLRISEVTAGPHNLAFQNVNLTSQAATITFTSFKHSSSAHHSLVLHATSSPVCPVRALARYLQLRPSASGPLFVFSDGAPLSAAFLNHFLRQCLSFSNLPTTNISSHSFRIGAATWAAANGHSTERIRLMGRWRSDAFKRYIRIPSISVSSSHAHN